jgi:hypothetical protein
MGVRLSSVSSNTLLTATLTQNTETAALTTPPLSLPLDNAQVFLFWYLTGSAGASTSGMKASVRRGSGLTGTIINAGVFLLVGAAGNFLVSGTYIDTPGVVAGQQYTLTATQSGATGAGSFLDGCFTAFVL